MTFLILAINNYEVVRLRMNDKKNAQLLFDTMIKYCVDDLGLAFLLSFGKGQTEKLNDSFYYLIFI